MFSEVALYPVNHQAVCRGSGVLLMSNRRNHRNTDPWIQWVPGIVGSTLVVLVFGYFVLTGAIDGGRFLLSVAFSVAVAILISLLWQKRSRNGG